MSGSAETLTASGLGLSRPSVPESNRARFWRLLWLTSRMEFRLQYHGSVLGFAWTLLHPLLLFGVIYLFFSQVIRFGGVAHYPALLLLNIMLYTFFAQATNASVRSLVGRERMLRATEFPRIVVPVSVVVTWTFGLILGLPVVFLFMLISGVEPMWTWVLTPVIVLLMVILALGTALVLSTLYVTLRDLAQIWGVAARALFYASPVVYVVDRVPESWRALEYANPIAPILTQARAWLIDPSAPSAIEAGGTGGLVASVAILIIIVAAGVWLFVRRAPRIAELL